ncbi:MAG: DUF1893 domain-containing protein [Ruminococcaceae bacterium]|nr:DUF1893 domain-containing protein [Oscillospiraceae bacterium]
MIDRAVELLSKGECTVVAITTSNEVITGNGTSVRPLFEIVEKNQEALSGGAVADRVIGKAAACLLCRSKVSSVFAYLMSEPALKLLDKYKISVSYEKLVKAIMNRNGTDLCPMEKTVADVEDINECFEKIKEFIKSTPPPERI